MNTDAFAIFANFLLNSSGLALRPDQTYLVRARLSPLLEVHACIDLDALAAKLHHPAEETLRRHVTEAMATHETSFLRDPRVFSYLRDAVLPAAMARNAPTKRLRIWSAGCATGQEPYSIAMVVRDMAPLRDWQVDITATDLSADAIARARRGTYSHFEVQRGLPAAFLLRHFTQDGTDWRIDDDTRRMVTFRTDNLVRDNGVPGAFDIVFCRNVLIYVSTDVRRTVLNRLERAVRPGGALILGAVESLNDPAWNDTGVPGVFTKSLHG